MREPPYSTRVRASREAARRRDREKQQEREGGRAGERERWERGGRKWCELRIGVCGAIGTHEKNNRGSHLNVKDVNY